MIRMENIENFVSAGDVENLGKIAANGVRITYQPVQEIRLPAKASLEEWLLPGVASVSTEGAFTGKKIGVFSAEKGLIAEIRYQKAKVTPSGFIHLTGKKEALIREDGTVLAGDECDEAQDLGEGFYAKKSQKRWAVFRADDRSAVTKPEYTAVSGFSEGSCAVTAKDGARLIGEDGMPLFDEVWEEAHPFHEGIARVRVKKETRYINREGKVIFSAEGQFFGDFFNGYAVISDKKGKRGAINAEGVLVIKPEYAFLKDCLSGMFVASNTGVYVPGKGFQGRSYGLIAADGRSVLPFSYDRIDGCPDGSYRYGHLLVWQASLAGNQVAYAALVYGIVSPEGKVLFPDRYAGIGPESEGLLAYKLVDHSIGSSGLGENTMLRFGYMTPDGKPVCEVASIDYAESMDKTRELLRQNMDAQLRPFRDGKAQVCVRNEFRHYKMPFVGEKTWSEARRTAWYEVDRQGKPVGGAPDLKQQLRDRGSTPFFADFCKKADSFEAMWDEGVITFDGMVEVNLSAESFAVLDSSMQDICLQHAAGLTAPLQSVTTGPAQHEKYRYLSQIAKNVWTAVTDSGTSVLFSEFESPTRFSDGLAAFRASAGLKKPRWGYMDIHGNTVIEAKYISASAFRNGYASVRDEQGGAILCRKATVTPAE